MDLAVAAASAAGECVVLPPKRRPQAPPPAGIDDDDDLLQYDEAEELPDVDDLEVAAAAAAAEHAALRRAAEAPLYAVPQRVLATPAPESMDTDDEEGDEDEDGGEPEVVLALEIVEREGEATVRVHLIPTDGHPGAGALSESSSSDDEGDIIGGPEDLRAMINALAADDDGEGDEPVERGADALGLPPPAAFDVDITSDEPVTEAGNIASLVEGMIIVQTNEGGRTLAEGSVLCLADRTPLGHVEDVFGPVKAPFYALRYYAGDVPANVAPGVAVFSVDQYADMLVPDKLKAKGYDAADADPADPDETKFSDDEEEVKFMRREQEVVKQRAQQTAAQLAPGRGKRSGRGRGPRSGRGRGGRGGRGGGGAGAGAGPQHMPYGGAYGVPAAGARWSYGPYGHYPVSFAVAAQYAATGYAPGGAPLAGWGPPAGGASPAGWPQQQQPPPGWDGQ